MQFIRIALVILVITHGFVIIDGFKLPSQRIDLFQPRSVAKLSSVTSSVSAEIQSSALNAVAKLLATCGIGATVAYKGILDQNAIKVLSSLVFNVFQPCLLFVNVCQTISAQRLSGSQVGWILPLAASCQILIGFSIGKLISLILYGRVRTSESKQFMASTTFANSGPLPLVFTDALFRLAPDKTLLPRSVAYISLYLLGWSPVFWVRA